MSEEKYNEGEEFFEVTFQIPKRGLEPKDVAEEITKNRKDACNVTVIPCRIIREPSRLSVSRDNYSYTSWNTKAESQIIEEKS